MSVSHSIGPPGLNSPAPNHHGCTSTSTSGLAMTCSISRCCRSMIADLSGSLKYDVCGPPITVSKPPWANCSRSMDTAPVSLLMTLTSTPK